jgi:U3 small nucleolar RNA-associated protein 11
LLPEFPNTVTSFNFEIIKLITFLYEQDYSLRAKDYNLKKAKLQRLREKARDRNPDEFAFGMLSAQTGRKGRHGARDGAAATLGQEVVKLLKTQDAGYLRLASDKIRKEIEKLEQDVRLQDGMKQILGKGNDEPNPTAQSSLDDDEDDFDPRPAKRSRKIVFADTLQEQQRLGGQVDSDEVEDDESENEDDDDDDDDDESDDLMDDSFGQLHQEKGQEEKLNVRKSKKQLQAEKQALKERRAARRLKKRAEEVRKNKLRGLQNQYSQLIVAERELDLQRGKMQHSVGGTNKHGLKWKIRERKR